MKTEFKCRNLKVKNYSPNATTSHSRRPEFFATPLWQHQILQLMLMMYLRWRQLYDESSHFGLMMLVVQLDLYLVWYSRATDGHCPFVAPSPPTSRAATPSASPWLPHAGTEQNWDAGTESFENVTHLQFKYLGMSLTNQNCMQKQIQKILN
jgi:hypothetical protein